MTTAQNIRKILTSTLSLADQRDLLKTQSYSDAFPTSPEARSAREYRTALEAFEAAHPEVVEEVRRADEAKRAAKRTTVDGMDILGI